MRSWDQFAILSNRKRSLKKGSVAVIVGGIAEMYMQVGARCIGVWVGPLAKVHSPAELQGLCQLASQRWGLHHHKHEGDLLLQLLPPLS
jgi:hypothetical protein